MAWCSSCDRYFNSEHALDQHLENSSRHNICDNCDMDFTTWEGLVQHYVQSPVHSYCRSCNEHFDDEDDLDVHFEDMHWYCPPCRRLFDSQSSLDQHDRQKHFYCIPCKRYFSNDNALNNHLRSSAVHNPRTRECPGRNCHMSFISYADLAQHLESGACRSGADRHKINALATKLDRNRVITNPNRLITGPDGFARASRVIQQYATERSWNGFAYECALCYRTFATLDRLNQHLGSPAHDSKIYRCPRQYDGCGSEYGTLSALMQHVESGCCTVHRFQSQVNGALDDLTSRMHRIGWN